MWSACAHTHVRTLVYVHARASLMSLSYTYGSHSYTHSHSRSCSREWRRWPRRANTGKARRQVKRVFRLGRQFRFCPRLPVIKVESRLWLHDGFGRLAYEFFEGLQQSATLLLIFFKQNILRKVKRNQFISQISINFYIRKGKTNEQIFLQIHIRDVFPFYILYIFHLFLYIKVFLV